MLKVIILEGPRGTGKSTVARLLRNAIEGSTLINLTGFKEDEDKGLSKIRRYYLALNEYLTSLKNTGEDFTIIFDRTFFSEMVYAPLYKSYDFSEMYKCLCELLLDSADSVEIFFLTVYDREEFAHRLTRDKVELFGSVEESVDQSLAQQRGYQQVFDNFTDEWGHSSNMKLYKIDTSFLTPEDVKNEILGE